MLNVPDYQCFNFHKKINFLFNFDVIFSHFMSHLNLSQTKHRHKVKKKFFLSFFHFVLSQLNEHHQHT